jgi:hypothetical protein
MFQVKRLLTAFSLLLLATTSSVAWAFNPAALALMSHSVVTATPENASVLVNDDIAPPVNYDSVAENILKVKLALAGKYEVADDTVFGLYILRYLAELGDNDLGHQDIKALIDSIEKLYGEPINPKLKDMLSKIKKVRFGQRRDKRYVKIYSMEGDIIVPLNRPMTGMIKEVKHLVIKDKARIYFEDFEGEKGLKQLVRFVKSKARILFFAPKALNQVHKDTIEHVEAYTQGVMAVRPIKFEAKDIYVTVDTSTIFKKMDFSLTQGVLMPGITDGRDGVPPMVFEARDGLISAKLTLDE